MPSFEGEKRPIPYLSLERKNKLSQKSLTPMRCIGKRFHYAIPLTLDDIGYFMNFEYHFNPRYIHRRTCHTNVFD